jgi:hypothetical protein
MLGMWGLGIGPGSTIMEFGVMGIVIGLLVNSIVGAIGGAIGSFVNQ